MSTAMDIVDTSATTLSSSSVDEVQQLLDVMVLKVFTTVHAVREDQSEDIRSTLGEPSVHAEAILSLYREIVGKIDVLPGKQIYLLFRPSVCMTHLLTLLLTRH